MGSQTKAIIEKNMIIGFSGQSSFIFLLKHEIQKHVGQQLMKQWNSLDSLVLKPNHNVLLS